MTENSHSTKTLSSLQVGQKAIVKTLKTSDGALRNRLLSMGIVAGTALELLCVAPLGDPIQIRALGYNLSLRLNEAHNVEVIPLNS